MPSPEVGRGRWQPNITVPSGGGNGTGTLTINVAAPSTAMTAMDFRETHNFRAAVLLTAPSGRSGWWTLSGGTGLAAILLLFVPGRKRYSAALGLALMCVLSFTLGCGGGSGGGGGGGTTPTVTHLTVSTTKVAVNGSITVSAASAPAFLALVGTHTLSASYLGDSTTGASTSGTLNMAVTGTTSLPIAANPASSNPGQTISLTIN